MLKSLLSHDWPRGRRGTAHSVRIHGLSDPLEELINIGLAVRIDPHRATRRLLLRTE